MMEGTDKDAVVDEVNGEFELKDQSKKDEVKVDMEENHNEKSEAAPFSPKPFAASKLEMMQDEASARVELPPNDETSELNPQHATFYKQTVNKSTAPQKTKEFMLRKFFAIRPNNFEHAVEDVKQYLKPTIDGIFHSAWLMAEIDHWDHEKERLIILTSTHLMLIKYNFVAQRIEECQRIQLHMIDRIQGGPFQYPDRSMTAARIYQNGIRISWNKKEVLTKWQRFSPFFNSPSYVTLALHKAGFHMNTVPSFMVYEDFKKALLELTQAAGAVFEVVVGPLFIEVYVGAVSTVHNSSDLGYAKDRGKVSF